MKSLSSLWEDLLTNSRKNYSGTFLLQLVDTKHPVRVYAGIAEQDSMPALLVELPKGGFEIKDFVPLKTHSFSCDYEKLKGLSIGSETLVLKLHDNRFIDLFSVFCEEIRESIKMAVSPDDIHKSIVRCIERWRKFIQRKNRNLTLEEVRGLYGELLVLNRCMCLYGADIAIKAWVGPSGALRDFELPDVSVEVKTYSSGSRSVIMINDPEQLDYSELKPSYLAAIRLAQVVKSGHTLPDLIRYISKRLADRPNAIDAFNYLLGEYGFQSIHSDMYAERFVADEFNLFSISSDFPRINLKKLPSEIVNVTFSLVLSALESHKTSPDGVIGNKDTEFEEGYYA